MKTLKFPLLLASQILCGALLIAVAGCTSPAVDSVKEPSIPAIPAAGKKLKPETGVAYFLPKVEIQLSAILTNVPNVNAMVTNYTTTELISNIVSSSITSVSTNVDKNGAVIMVTNTIYQQATNIITTVSVIPSTNSMYLISITPIIMPDPEGLYNLAIVPDSWGTSSDTFNFQVDSNGFLESLNASNADQTVQIVSELAQAAAQIALAPSMPAAAAAAQTPAPLVSPLPGRVDLIFDPTTETGQDGLANAQKYLTQRFVQCKAPDSPSEIEKESCPIKLNTLFKGGNLPAQLDDYLSSYEPTTEGVVYRPLLPYVLIVQNNFGQSGTNFLQYLVMSPNRSPVFSLSVDRALLVTRTTSISFNSGFLGNVNYSNPSQTAALLGLPLTVVGDIFSSITNVLQLRFNIASSQNNIAAQQTSLVNQEAALNNATTNLLLSAQNLNEFKRTQATNSP